MSRVDSTEAVMDRAVFRDVVGYFMTGVTVITTRDASERYGVTASAVASLSLDPPMVLICLNRNLPTCAAVRETQAFVVNILAEEQGELAKQFATRQIDKFKHARVEEAAVGVPLLADALAHLECRLVESVDAATHTVFLAEVQTARARPGSPLAYFRGTFGRFEQSIDEAVYQELRERVLDRQIALGQAMSIDGLADDLGVGRAPVYHALQKLQSEGLISADPDKGYVVRPVTVAIAWEAYDARAAIECGVVDQVGERLTTEELQRLRAAAEATVPWIKNNRFVDFDRYLSTNTTFHETLVQLSGNEALVTGYRRLAMAGIMSRALQGVEETNDRFTQDHVDLAKALESSDVETARQIVITHAALGKERVRIAIEAAGGEY